jgi:hypothetical protein
MSLRFVLLATAASFALASPAFALDRDSDFEMIELAQAAPPAATAAGRTFSPKSMCQDMLARRIGNRAYIKARLELKPEQMTAWNAFEKASDEAVKPTLTALYAVLTPEQKAILDRPRGMAGGREMRRQGGPR